MWSAIAPNLGGTNRNGPLLKILENSRFREKWRANHSWRKEGSYENSTWLAAVSDAGESKA